MSEVIVEAPPRGPLRRGLLIDAVYEMDTTFQGVARGGAGVRFFPLGCPELTTLPADPCDDDIEDLGALVNEANSYPEDVTFAPFAVGAVLGCSTLGNVEDDILKRLQSDFRGAISYSLMEELTSGTISGTGFVDHATAIGAADTVTEVFEGAEFFLGERLKGFTGVIYLNPWAAAQYGDKLDTRDGGFFTHTGHRVVFDPGVAFGEAWTSGPVGLWLTEGARLADLRESLSRSTNKYNEVLGAYGVFAFDPCAVGKMTIAAGGSGFPRAS